MRGHLHNHPEESVGWNRDKDIKKKKKSSKGKYKTIITLKKPIKLCKKDNKFIVYDTTQRWTLSIQLLQCRQQVLN